MEYYNLDNVKTLLAAQPGAAGEAASQNDGHEKGYRPAVAAAAAVEAAGCC